MGLTKSKNIAEDETGKPPEKPVNLKGVKALDDEVFQNSNVSKNWDFILFFLTNGHAVQSQIT